MNYEILYLFSIFSIIIKNNNMTTNTSLFDIDDENFSYYINSLSLIAKNSKHHEVSPVTLSSEWSRMGRLLLLSCLSVIGTVGNIFMISSVMIEDHLKKTGNSQ
jgi:hypothetical protein